MDFIGINQDLVQTAEDIQIEGQKFVLAQMDYLQAKAIFLNTFSKSILENKLKSPTMTAVELRAKANDDAYPYELGMITSKGKFESIKNRLQGLRDRLDALKEKSYNLRREGKDIR